MSRSHSTTSKTQPRRLLGISWSYSKCTCNSARDSRGAEQSPEAERSQENHPGPVVPSTNALRGGGCCHRVTRKTRNTHKAITYAAYALHSPCLPVSHAPSVAPCSAKGSGGQSPTHTCHLVCFPFSFLSSRFRSSS